jgi:hypothetical protein
VPRDRAAELAPWLFLAHLGVTLVAFIGLGMAWSGTLDEGPWITVGSVAFVALGGWAYWSWHLATGRYFDAYAVFLLALLLFSGGQLILLALGLLPGGLLDGQFGQWTTLRTVWLVVASIAAFHLGGLQRARGSARAARVGAGEDGEVAQARLAAYQAFGLALLAISAPAMVWQTLEALRLAAVGGYLAIYQREVSVGLQNWDGILASSFAPALLLVFASHADRSGWRHLCWVLAALSVAAHLMVGSRAAAVLILAPMLLLQHVLVAPVRRAAVVALAAAGLVLFPVIAQVRAQSMPERRRELATSSFGAESLFVPAIREMGGTMSTIAETIDLVPAARPYDAGEGYFRALSTAVPNVFGELHPAVRGGTYAQWLMARIDPVQFALGGGIGFSMVAEAYANFSWAGALVVMFVFGLGLAAAVGWSRAQPGVIGMATEATLLAAISVLPRAESSNVVRGVVWYVLLPLAFAAWRGRRRAAQLGTSPALRESSTQLAPSHSSSSSRP